MKSGKIIVWDTAFLIVGILFLSTKNWSHYNLIIGLTAINISRYCVKYHFDYYKITGKIY